MKPIITLLKGYNDVRQSADRCTPSYLEVSRGVCPYVVLTEIINGAKVPVTLRTKKPLMLLLVCRARRLGPVQEFVEHMLPCAISRVVFLDIVWHLVLRELVRGIERGIESHCQLNYNH